MMFLASAIVLLLSSCVRIACLDPRSRLGRVARDSRPSSGPALGRGDVSSLRQGSPLTSVTRSTAPIQWACCGVCSGRDAACYHAPEHARATDARAAHSGPTVARDRERREVSHGGRAGRRAPTRSAAACGACAKAAGLSQEELAERAGLTAQAVGALERGDRRHPYPETVRRLADALGLSDEARAALIAAVPRRAAAGQARRPARARGAPPPRRRATRREPDSARRRGRPALPAPLTPLVGREADVAAVLGLLRAGACGC